MNDVNDLFHLFNSPFFNQMNFVYAIQIQHDSIRTQTLKIVLTKVAVATYLKPYIQYSINLKYLNLIEFENLDGRSKSSIISVFDSYLVRREVQFFEPLRLSLVVLKKYFCHALFFIAIYPNLT